MKRHLHVLVVWALAAAGLMAGRGVLAQAGRPVAITVNVASDTERKGQGTGVQVTEKKTLQITVANLTGQDFAALQVKYHLFGKAADDKKVSVTRSGEEEVKLARMGKVKVESGTVGFTFTPRHTEKVGKSNITVPPAGEKYAGYAVQVYQGTNMLTEAIEPVDLRPILLAEMQQQEKEAKEDKEGKKKEKKAE